MLTYIQYAARLEARLHCIRPNPAAAGDGLKIQAISVPVLRPFRAMHVAFYPYLIICFILFSAFSWAAPGIRESFSRGTITVGDRVEFTLTVTLPAKATTGDLPGGLLLQAFEIKDYDLGKWEEKGGEKTLTQRFTISTFTTGTYMVPPWGLKYKLDGKDITVQVPALPLTVASVLKGQEETPKDIRKPFAIPRAGLPWWAYAAGAAVLAAVVAAFLLLRRRKKAAEAATEPQLPPHVRALKALLVLEREEFIRKGEAKKHYVGLTEIFKDYIGGRFALDTLDKTTSELWDQVKGLPIERGMLLQVRDFLTTSDLVKFAKHIVPEERGEQDLFLVRETVEKTKEVPRVDAA
jgi:hypothetical protein